MLLSVEGEGFGGDETFNATTESFLIRNSSPLLSGIETVSDVSWVVVNHPLSSEKRRFAVYGVSEVGTVFVVEILPSGDIFFVFVDILQWMTHWNLMRWWKCCQDLFLSDLQ